MTRLKQTPVAAVELLDRAVAALGAGQARPARRRCARCRRDGAALLVETRARDGGGARRQDRRDRRARSAGCALAAPVRFSTDPAECGALWNVRKGMFPAVGAMRPIGHHRDHRGRRVPGGAPRRSDARPAAACSQRTAIRDAIIFGHALEGNLHFVFTQDFGIAAEVERYRGFMDELCAMVVENYDGSLKAEHGTGRNMAPFVELEWGAQAYATMRRIKALFDPQRPAQPRRDPQRRPALAPEEPEAAAGRAIRWSTSASNAASASRSARRAA